MVSEAVLCRDGIKLLAEEVSAVICSHMFSQTYDICMSNL